MKTAKLNRIVKGIDFCLPKGTIVEIVQDNTYTCMVRKASEPNLEYKVSKDSLTKVKDNVPKTLQLILKESVTSSMFAQTFPKGKILNVTLMNNRIYVHHPKNELCLIAVTKTNIERANFKFKGVIDSTVLCDLKLIAERDQAIVKNEVSKLVRLDNVQPKGRTASQFQKKFWSGFNNSDLGNDLEKHLSTVNDGDRLKIKTGKDSNASELQPYYLEVNDTGYAYATKSDRDFDKNFLNKLVAEFKRENNL